MRGHFPHYCNPHLGTASTFQALPTDTRPVTARLEAQGGATGSKAVKTSDEVVHS